MTNKKYELIEDDTIKANGKTLYRIKALVDINKEVKAGDEGGYIESEENLATGPDKSWVYDDAMVFDKALVCNGSVIRGVAMVYGKAVITDEAEVIDNAKVYGLTVIDGGKISGTAEVDLTWSSKPGEISEAQIYDNAKLKGDITIEGGEIGGHANFNVPDGEHLVLLKPFYVPSKKVEIVSAAQAKEIFGTDKVDYDDIEGASLGD